LKKFWSKKAIGLMPYTAGEQPRQKLIKLNTNENAYPPSPKVAKAIDGLSPKLRLYPNADSDDLRDVIAERHGISPSQVFCSNGSDEALAFCFLAFFDPGRPVRTLDVTYSFYPVWANLFDLTLEEIPLKIDYTADIDALCGGYNAVIANPNAPTSISMGISALERIIRTTSGVVVVDEAYVAFGGESALRLLKKYDNLAIVRTLSKSHSLAGLRVGYVMADDNLISALNAVKDSFNSYPVDMLAQAAAAAAIRDVPYYEDVTARIIADRGYTARALADMGLEVLPSSANFIFVKVREAENIFRKLRENGILVRYFPQGRTSDFLRVTIGTTVQMQAFIETMKGIL